MGTIIGSEAQALKIVKFPPILGLTLVFLFIFSNLAEAKRFSHELYYHCEGTRLKNGKSLWDNPQLDIYFKGGPKVVEFWLTQRNGDRINLIQHFRNGVWALKSSTGKPQKINLINPLNQIKEIGRSLKKAYGAKLRAVPRWPKLELHLKQNAHTGLISVGPRISLHFEEKNPRVAEFNFTPKGKKVDLEEMMPGNNLSHYVGNLNYHFNKDNGMLTLMISDIKSSYLNHQLLCQSRIKNRFEKKTFNIPKSESKELKISLVKFTPTASFYSNGSLLVPIFDLTFLSYFALNLDEEIFDKEKAKIKKILKTYGPLKTYAEELRKENESFDKASLKVFNDFQNIVKKIDLKIYKKVSGGQIKKALQHSYITILETIGDL